MAFEIRAIEPDELDEFAASDRRAFGVAPPASKISRSWTAGELDRTRAAFENGAIVGGSRAYSFELTLPGGAIVPAAAVSWVGVQPTHRRRGVLTQMMRALHDDARERGEPAAILTASESVIYGRFGYGTATWRLGTSVERAHAQLGRPFDDAGRVRIVTRDEAEKLLPPLYDGIRRGRAGMVSRPDYWWPEVFWGTADDEKASFVVVHEDPNGVADGFASYEIAGSWTGGHADREVRIWDLQSSNDPARRALWQYLLGIDLVRGIMAWNVPVDEPLRHLLRDPRRARVDYVNDGMWLAPLDPVALLSARRYSAFDGHLVIEVLDPDGSATYAIDGNDREASCTPTTDAPDLSMTTPVLGAMSLGGNRFTEYAAAGLIDEHRAGALALADAMFMSSPVPACTTAF
jgi:predicted acetyltransferase